MSSGSAVEPETHKDERFDPGPIVQAWRFQSIARQASKHQETQFHKIIDFIGTAHVCCHSCRNVRHYCSGVEVSFHRSTSLQTPGNEVPLNHRFHRPRACVSPFVPQCVFHDFCLANKKNTNFMLFMDSMGIVFCIANEACLTSGGCHSGLNPKLEYATPATMINSSEQ